MALAALCLTASDHSILTIARIIMTPEMPFESVLAVSMFESTPHCEKPLPSR